MSRRLVSGIAIAGLVGVLTLGGLAGSASAAAVGPTTIGNFTYTADDSDLAAGATITAYSGTDAQVVIPSSVELAGTTYVVTTLGSNAFNGNTTMSSVTIPDTITTMGDYVFHGDTALTSITIPDSVTTLGSNDFQYDTAMTSAVVGDGVTGFPNSTFQDDSSLISLSIGNSVAGIGDFAIAFDTSLTSITWGSSVSNIGNYTFYDDSALTTVVLPPSLVGLGGDAFNGAPNLDHVEFTGPPPGYVTAAGPDASLGTATGLIVYYPWAYAQPQSVGGFTPGWEGYTTVELATVSFNLDGYGSTVAPEKVAIGDAATSPPTPSSPGRIFNGWYTNAALTTKADFADPITADTTLFASWSTLAATGQPLNPWLLPASIAMLMTGLLFVVLIRRRSTAA